MPKEVPTLSPQGWLSSPAEKIDRLLSYYFLTHASQSNLFQGSLVSLPKQVQQYGHDPDTLREEIRETLQSYLQPYFDSASVEVAISYPEKDNDRRYDVRLDIVLTQDGERHTAGHLISTLDSVVTRYMAQNNYGEFE